MKTKHLLENLDDEHELIEGSPYTGDITIDTIFDHATMLKTKEDCRKKNRPKGRFFCNYKLVKSVGTKYDLVPLNGTSETPLKLSLKRVPSDSNLSTLKGNWVVNLDRIDESALTSIENNSLLSTPQKRRLRAPPVNYKNECDENLEFACSPIKKSRRSAVKNESVTPHTPKGIPARRKSILKTPTMSKSNTPRRSICFNNVIAVNEYKKSANDKVMAFDNSDEERDEFSSARKRLHVAAVPKSLPCRENEFIEIYNFLEGNLCDEIGGCIYISGVPGTGKTATTTAVVRSLKAEVEKDNLPEFDFVEINGMRITEPRKAYVEIHRQLTGKTVSWEQAYNLLDKRFSTPSPKRKTTIMIVDELDILCNKRQDVVYNLLNWPNLNSARLIVVTIANTMDLPERVLMGKVSSRLGLTRLTFQPYSHKQLQEIVTSRLSGLDSFNSDAIQLVARKVAALSGDARRALDICRRATEIGEGEAITKNEKPSVSMLHVQQALNEMISNTKVKAIKSCSKMEKMFLQAVCVEVERTGIEEVTFRAVYNQLKTLVGLNGLQLPPTGACLTISARLGASRLLISEHSRKDINQKILLNISADDFYYAVQMKQQD